VVISPSAGPGGGGGGGAGAHAMPNIKRTASPETCRVMVIAFCGV
jgi:hypothetical protein